MHKRRGNIRYIAARLNQSCDYSFDGQQESDLSNFNTTDAGENILESLSPNW